MDDEEFRVEMSPVSGEFTKDGITVEVQVYRVAGQEGWILEVIYNEDIATIWEEPFDTDTEAVEEFWHTVATDGMATFLDDEMTGRIH